MHFYKNLQLFTKLYNQHMMDLKILLLLNHFSRRALEMNLHYFHHYFHQFQYYQDYRNRKNIWYGCNFCEISTVLWFLSQSSAALMSWVGWWVELLFMNRLSATRYMKVKRMGITGLLRRVCPFTTNEIKSSESFSKQPTNSSHLRTQLINAADDWLIWHTWDIFS